MWNLGNRVVICALTTIILCVLLYKVWGPIFALTLSLVVVVHTCYSLLVNDSFVSPHALVLVEYVKNAFSAIEWIVEVAVQHTIYGFEIIKQRLKYQQGVEYPGSEMNHRRAGYRLSTDFADQSSPITRGSYRIFPQNGDYGGGRTSTPLSSNGGIGVFAPMLQQHVKKTSPLGIENGRSLPARNETFFTPKNGSPWGTSISPKLRERASGVKTVQTVAGPLLASTRYNIDPMTYSDVTSPGLTTRLTKYASEASNKLTHQSQYSTGQFPKVNLKANPTPLINPKLAKTRTPVTVKIAPMIMSISPRHRKQSVFENVQNEAWGQESNVSQVLKEISLKRHASQEDIMSDLVKKQRIDKALESDKESESELDNFEEMMQKRARDDSTTSEDESLQRKALRPTKRSKASCNEISNSLSSSVHVLSGVKRKAMDISRSSTPDIEKHFKSSSRPQSLDYSFSLNEQAASKQDLNIKSPISAASGEPHQKLSPEEENPSKQNVNSKLPRCNEEPEEEVNEIQTKNPAKITNLSDKLFMRAEPKNNKKLQTLIKEQGSVEARFSDDKAEIKKTDIVIMRQTSMRARLQSMFDAISGKSASKIDPDVVIQAEEVNPPNSTSFTPSKAVTSLSSITSTTNTNTSPITSSSIVPILKSDTVSKSPTLKHVTFNLPSATSTAGTDASTKSSVTISNATSSTNLPLPSFNTPITSIPPVTLSFGTSSATSTSAITNIPNFSTTSNTLAATTNRFTLPSSTSIQNTTALKVNGIDPPKSDTNSTLFSTKSMPSLIATPSTVLPPTMKNVSTGLTFGSIATVATTVSTTTSTSTFTVPSLTSSAPTTTLNAQNTVVSSSSGSNMLSLFGDMASKNSTPQTTTQNTSHSTFGNITTKSGFSFGNSNSLAPVESIFNTSAATTASNTTTTSQSSFFSSPITTSASTPSAVPNFSAALNSPLVTTSTLTSGTTTTSSAGFSFGASSLGTSKQGFSFGVSTTSAPNASPAITSFTSTTGNTASPFSAAISTALPSLGTSNQQPHQQIQTPSIFAPKSTAAVTTTTTMSLGASSGTSTFGSSAPNLFGSSSAPLLFSNNASSPANTTFNTPTTTTSLSFGSSSGSTPTFGASNATSFGNAPISNTGNSLPTFSSITPSNLFSLTTSSSAVTTTSSTSAVFGTPATQSLFSGATSSTSTAATTPSIFSENSSIFGQSKSQPTLSFGGTNPTFGTSNSAPVFGSQPATAPVFGATNVTQSPSLPTFSAPKPAFPPPAFGSTLNNNVSTPAPFGGMGNSAPSFNTSAASSPFAQTSTFGGATMNNNNHTNNNTGSTFSFGATQPPQQPTSSFSFSGTATSSAPSTTAFQFGAASAAKPAGFNFSAAPTTSGMTFGASATTAFNAPAAASGFAAPASNMFSIGTGTTTPRPRATRQRKQR